MIIDKRKYELEIHSICHNGNKMEYMWIWHETKRKQNEETKTRRETKIHTQRMIQAADFVAGTLDSEW